MRFKNFSIPNVENMPTAKGMAVLADACVMIAQAAIDLGSEVERQQRDIDELKRQVQILQHQAVQRK